MSLFLFLWFRDTKAGGRESRPLGGRLGESELELDGGDGAGIMPKADPESKGLVT